MNSNNVMKFGEWIKSKIGWFITLIIATVLSLAVVNMTDIVLKFEILFVFVFIFHTSLKLNSHSKNNSEMLVKIDSLSIDFHVSNYTIYIILIQTLT